MRPDSPSAIPALAALVAAVPAVLVADPAPLPSAYDLRDIGGHSYIGPVHDQGQAGTCYAFATCALAEAAYNLRMGLADLSTADFSESFIAYSMDPFYEGISGVSGGAMEGDFFQALVDYGVCTEADFPYVITDPGEGNHHLDAPRVQFSSWHTLPSYDVETAKRAMLQFGAVSVGLNMDEPFYDYTGGIFSNADTAMDMVDLYESTMNHIVAAVGWQEDAAAPSGGYWILRNSWGVTDWGEDGYMRMDYFSGKAATLMNYVVLDGWEGEDFDQLIDTDILAGSAHDASQTGPSAYGVYEWGGNNARIINEADVTVEHVSGAGYGLTHGLFLWGGSNATLINFGTVTSSITSTNGVATAYGACLQGGSLVNAQESTIGAFATGDGVNRATAYGAAFYAFDIDGAGELVNIGRIDADATGANSWAYGIYVVGGEYALNQGLVMVNAGDMATGLLLQDVDLGENGGSLSVRSQDGASYGVSMSESALLNTGAIEAVSEAGSGASHGVYADKSDIVNEGVITSLSDAGASVGVHLAGGSFANASSGTVGAYTYGEIATVGLDASNATIVNDGRIRGDENNLKDCTISGTGIFYGAANLENCILNPGNSIGTLNMGSLASSGSLTLNMEIAGGEADLVYVRHSASVEGEGNVLNVVHSGYLPAGDYVFIQAGEGATGAFQTVNTAALFVGSVFAGANGFTLDLDRHSYSDFALMPAYEAMGVALDGSRPLATGELAAMLDGIDSYADAASVQNALTQLYPALEADLSAFALDAVRQGNSFVTRHWKSRAGSEPFRAASAWYSYTDGDIDFAASGEFGRIDGTSRRSAAGAEYRVGSRLTVGASFVQGEDRLRYVDRSDSGKVQSEQFFVHAMWDRKGGSEGPYAGAAIGVGTMDIDSRRSVDFLGATVRGSHNATTGSLWLGGGWDLNNKIWTTRPFVDLQYSSVSEDAHTQTGGEGASLAFDSLASDSLMAGFGMSVSANFHYGRTQIIPELRIVREEEMLGDADPLKARFAPGPAFAVNQRDLSGSRTTMGAALRAVVDERISAALDYERREFDMDDSIEESFSAHVQVRF
jgi:hypothetical protein